jgi:ferredoxin
VKVVVDAERCEGNGRCQAFAPEVFQLRGDETFVIMEDIPESLKIRVEEAIRLCPRQAISWVKGS